MKGLWLALALCIALPGQAGVYKYVNAAGVVSYTDDRDLAAPFNPEELEYLDPDPDKVRLRYTPSGNLFIINELHGPVTVSLQLSTRDGVESLHDLSEPIIVAAQSEQFVDQLRYHGTGALEIHHTFVIGAPSLTQDADLVVPFRGRYRISQGFEGRFSHHLPGNRYALDIPMPEGTPVLAARTGVVFDMKMGFSGSSQDPAARARTNYIRLLHGDGTMTVYAHLRTGTARVQPGQSVAAGQMIAESGNTGYSTAPHLHFALQRNDGQRLVSIPFHFQGQTPQQGGWLGN